MPYKTLADIRASRERTAALKAQGINPKKMLAGPGINPPRMTAPSSSSAITVEGPSKPTNASVKNHSNRVTKSNNKAQAASKQNSLRKTETKASKAGKPGDNRPAKALPTSDRKTRSMTRGTDSTEIGDQGPEWPFGEE